WETRWKTLGAQVKARAERNQKGLDLKRPDYQSDLKPVPLREPRVPVITAPFPASTAPMVADLATAEPRSRLPGRTESQLGAQKSPAESCDSLALTLATGSDQGSLGPGASFSHSRLETDRAPSGLAAEMGGKADTEPSVADCEDGAYR